MKRLFAALFLLCAATLFAQTRPAADLIVTNARVWTVDKNKPRAEAVAVIGQRIVAVGSSADIDRWRGPDTTIVDARGRVVVPGFNDAHVHLTDGGLSLTRVQLKDAATPQEFARRIGERAKSAPQEWILGGEWDEQQWEPARLPTRQLIDAVTADTPVFVNRYDGHMALANSLALKLAGITAATKDPPGGAIVRDAQGNPTGVLKDAAMDFVYKVIPAMSRAEREKAIRAALQHAASLGVTSMQDMGSAYDDIAVLAELEEKGELITRVYAAIPIANWEDEAKLGLRRAFGSTYLRVGGLKGYADGSLGSTTAYFFEPYTDAPKTRGLLSDAMIPVSKMRDRMLRASAADLQLCIHAIGDQGISIILDLFEEVEKAQPRKEHRFRIEHAQHMAKKDFKRFATLDVTASMQPYHAIDDGRWAEKRIGPERIKTTYAFRTFLDNKVRLAFGTDWFVAPLNPMLSLYAAVTRATLDGKNPDGWVPEEKITLEEAVEAYTMGSAYAEFQEKEKGSITAGKLADMVILSDDIFSIFPKAIGDVKVETTIVGGKVVYQRP